MAVRDAGPRSHRGDADATARARRLLRARWRTASLAAGWRFPSDWAVPEVDLVCASIVARSDPGAALAGLGRARAHSGAGLEETLADLTALQSVTGPMTDEHQLLRTTALAWADASVTNIRMLDGTDALTGLASESYLRTRLGEVYRQAGRTGRAASDRYVLVVVTLDLRLVTGWPRMMAMIVLADVLRSVFDGGESLAVLGPSVAVVLAERDRALIENTTRARWLAADRLGADPHLRSARCPEVRVEHLPCGYEAARDLLVRISRA